MELLLITLFAIKHFIVDFPMQKPYQWMNKGTYGHPGGLLHSGLHGLFTLAILVFFTNPFMALFLALVDSIVHYHVDWAKVNINKKYGWAANTHDQFWILVGFDQLLHMLTYVVIALVVTA